MPNRRRVYGNMVVGAGNLEYTFRNATPRFATATRYNCRRTGKPNLILFRIHCICGHTFLSVFVDDFNRVSAPDRVSCCRNTLQLKVPRFDAVIFFQFIVYRRRPIADLWCIGRWILSRFHRDFFFIYLLNALLRSFLSAFFLTGRFGAQKTDTGSSSPVLETLHLATFGDDTVFQRT